MAIKYLVRQRVQTATQGAIMVTLWDTLVKRLAISHMEKTAEEYPDFYFDVLEVNHSEEIIEHKYINYVPMF